MIKYQYTSSGYRPLEQIKGKKIIDIGGANSFAHGYLDAIIEIREPQAACTYKFIGDMDLPELWKEVERHVMKHGKWDYAICSHTLEDINNPFFVCRQIERIAQAGIIILPSKYRELARFSDPQWRGYMHHKWIFDILDGKLTGWPKSAYIEDRVFDDVHKELEHKEELIIEWEGEIGMRIINDGMPFNGDEHFRECYKLLI